MSSAIADLENNLQAMLALRPPGVTGTRIAHITDSCIANVQSESVLIQKIFTHFKKAPATHKLGVLYVVDSVTRKWLEQVKQQGAVVSNAAPDGTPAAGVNRVSELMPILMNDIISCAPQDQKEKIRKLLDIWEKGQTFPAAQLESYKQKLNQDSTTPPDSPPAHARASLNMRPNPAPSAPSAIPADLAQTLANLSKIAQQSSSTHNAPASVPTAVQPPNPTPYNAGPPSNLAATPFMNHVQSGHWQTPQAAGPPAGAPAPPFLPQAPSLATYGSQNVVANAANGMLPGVATPAPALGADQQMVDLIKQLAARGLPADTIATIVKALNPGAAPAAAPLANPGGYSMPPNATASAWAQPRPDDRSMRSPTNRPRGRSRSRSPGRQWDHRESPRSGRDDRRFGDFGRNSPPRERFEDRDRTRFRQRSPAGRRGSSPQRGGDEMPAFQEQKPVEFDSSLPQGSIKVMSRTLFVGGVTCSEQELRSIFSRFGAVQTCIVNKDKRHAFVKMYTRRDAVTAKTGMEPGRSPDAQLRTRWGVGFGPRDCSDYQTGISVIPIQKLTDADRKWMLTAAWGGSGGQPIQTGMVVEEPDIEIGAGVSSKAISRRMQTDKGGNQGPKSSVHRDNEERNDRGRHGRRGGGGRDHAHGGRRDDHGNPNNEPVVSPFGYGVQVGQNGMPVFPPGFQGFPAPDGVNNSQY